MLSDLLVKHGEAKEAGLRTYAERFHLSSSVDGFCGCCLSRCRRRRESSKANASLSLQWARSIMSCFAFSKGSLVIIGGIYGFFFFLPSELECILSLLIYGSFSQCSCQSAFPFRVCYEIRTMCGPTSCSAAVA